MNYFYGYPAYWDNDAEIWRYSDTNEPAIHPSKRPCPQCHQLPTPEGHDACLGTILGACAACCGHGVETGYIAWDCDGKGLIEQAWEIRLGKRRVKLALITEVEETEGVAVSDPRTI